MKGWKEVGSKNWCVSTGLTNKSVIDFSSTNLIVKSEKLIVSFDCSVVNFIVAWKLFKMLRICWGGSSPGSQIRSHLRFVFYPSIPKIFEEKSDFHYVEC